MERLLRLSQQQISFWVCCGMIIALIYSKFMLTVGMILLLLISLVQIGNGNTFKISFRPEAKNLFQKLWRRKDLLVLSFFFLIVLLSGIYSSDMNYLGERLRIKLPFLILPFAFASLPAFTEKQYYGLFYFLMIVVVISTIPVGFHYLQHYEIIQENIQKGKTIPTPMNHIRYSLMIAFSVLSGAVLWWKGFYIKYAYERYWIAGVTIFLFVFIHILSVRSGLLILYLSIFLLVFRFIFISQKFFLGLGMIVGLCIFGFFALETIPSLKSKVNYMRYDFEQYLKGNNQNYSDAERLISMEAGIKIGNQNPVFGVGAGDLKSEVSVLYKKDFPEISKPKMPHNQLISVYAGSGILGLAIFLFAFFYPLWYRKNYQDILFTILHLIVFCSFFMENTLETAVGVAFYILFLLFGLNYLNGKNVPDQ